ncbi:NifU family protein [Desulfonatronum thiodismutans]|uniref:NifU family protein n=1 Tax=Desulfonatronum thiodismutans TaxID=159290 RepID=UPI0004ABD736|nr:NifU family protein [Desulfonatronum thiodismutans]
MREKVLAVLETIRPHLQRDGGDVELVDVSADAVVTVRLTGACKECPMSQVTLKNAVEKTILKELPEIRSVQAA